MRRSGCPSSRATLATSPQNSLYISVHGRYVHARRTSPRRRSAHGARVAAGHQAAGKKASAAASPQAIKFCPAGRQPIRRALAHQLMGRLRRGWRRGDAQQWSAIGPWAWCSQRIFDAAASYPQGTKAPWCPRTAGLSPPSTTLSRPRAPIAPSPARRASRAPRRSRPRDICPQCRPSCVPVRDCKPAESPPQRELHGHSPAPWPAPPRPVCTPRRPTVEMPRPCGPPS